MRLLCEGIGYGVIIPTIPNLIITRPITRYRIQ